MIFLVSDCQDATFPSVAFKLHIQLRGEAVLYLACVERHVLCFTSSKNLLYIIYTLYYLYSISDSIHECTDRPHLLIGNEVTVNQVNYVLNQNCNFWLQLSSSIWCFVSLILSPGQRCSSHLTCLAWNG